MVNNLLLQGSDFLTAPKVESGSDIELVTNNETRLFSFLHSTLPPDITRQKTDIDSLITFLLS